MTSEYRKPLPQPGNPTLTQPFWEATRRHELIIPRCKQCDQFFFYPREACPNCLAGQDSLEWARVSGRGRLHTFTIVHQPAHQAFADNAPYGYCIIQLDEGPRMPGNVVGVDPHELKVDMPVEVTFDDVTPEVTLVKWRPVQG